jgi:hypothetical protein
MRRVITIVLIFIASDVVALFISPPDPWSHWLLMAAILLVAIPAYMVGLHESRTKVNTSSDVTMNDVAKTK